MTSKRVKFSDKDRELAKRIYLQSGGSHKDVLQTFPQLNKKTLQTWIARGQWSQQKRELDTQVTELLSQDYNAETLFNASKEKIESLFKGRADILSRLQVVINDQLIRLESSSSKYQDLRIFLDTITKYNDQVDRTYGIDILKKVKVEQAKGDIQSHTLTEVLKLARPVIDLDETIEIIDITDGE